MLLRVRGEGAAGGTCSGRGVGRRVRRVGGHVLVRRDWGGRGCDWGWIVSRARCGVGPEAGGGTKGGWLSVEEVVGGFAGHWGGGWSGGVGGRGEGDGGGRGRAGG